MSDQSDDDARDQDQHAGVPDSDPAHIDPAGDLADAVESGDLGLSLDDDADADELREFVERAEAGEFGPVTPDLEAQVRIVRALLEDADGESDAGAE
jgi:hypothetical protein